MRVYITRTILVLLALSIVPLALMGYTASSNCHDPVARLTAPNQKLQSIEAKRIAQGLVVSHATYGMALTLDANTGQVVSYYRSGTPLRCADEWEPGSVMKPLTIATALDSNSISSNFTFYDNGQVTVNHQSIVNWMEFPKGTKNLEVLLRDSLNVGAVAVLQNVTKQTWHDYLQNHFMLNASGQGYIPSMYYWNNDYRYAISAFGIGVVTSPIQLSLAYASLINGGVYHSACFSEACTTPGKQVVRSSTANTMKQLLTKIYLDTSTGPIPGYTIGGKSGSAPMAQQTDEYYTGDDNGTYISFIEHNGKTYIELIRLDQPQGYPAASHAARDVWQNVLNDIVASHALK